MSAEPRHWVRAAVPADAAAIREVAARAWRATYAGRLGDETIERYLAAAYAEERIGVRIERHDVLVAGPTGLPETVEAFAEVAAHPDHVQLVAVYTLPSVRGRGLGTALVRAVRSAYPDRDLAADVLLGNGLAEPFYAARGFVPGDELTDEIAGELVRERRWWHRAGAPGGVRR